MSLFVERVVTHNNASLGEVSDECKPVVVGVDFGTAYSGVGVALKSAPGVVECSGPGTQLHLAKVPTALLELPTGEWKFGFEAEDMYNQILMTTEPGNDPDAQLFRGFKIALKDRNAGFDTLMVSSAAGKTHSLLDLVTRSLCFLKDHAITIANRLYGSDVNAQKDVQWVVTVPAIWSDFSKAFMRKAAFQAGMMEDEPSDHLLLVLEPEAAAVSAHTRAVYFNLLGEDSKFMVLDCGGGTVDISVHEVLTAHPLTLNTVSAAAGGAWGSGKVNVAFRVFLEEFLGPDLFDERSNWLGFQSVYTAFERAKLTFGPQGTPLGVPLVDVLDHPGQQIILAGAYNARYQESLILTHATPSRLANLNMSTQLMLNFYDTPVAATVAEIKRVLAEVGGVRHIIVVGGFGASAVMIVRIHNEFHMKGGVRVLLPKHPQRAVVLGAVTMGLYRNIIANRVCPNTYGIKMSLCQIMDNAFQVLVAKGEVIPRNHEVVVSALPATAEQMHIKLQIFRSDLVEPATTAGQHQLGQLVIPCPPNAVQGQRKMNAIFCFGDVELRVAVEDASGNRTVLMVTME